jgi:hypothetical protein
MRPVTLTLSAGFALCFISLAARAQQPPLQDAFLDHLAGNWVSQGNFVGEQTTHDLSAEWILNHQYLLIHDVSRATENGHPAFDTKLYVGWDAAAKQYACVWLDNMGGLSPESLGYATRTGDELLLVFKHKDDETHLTFAYNAGTNSWDVRMDTVKDGVRDPVVRATLARQN